MPDIPEICWSAAADEIVESLRRYIAFPTVNPPGDVEDAVAYIASLLQENGLVPTILTPAPGKSILVAKLAGIASGDGIILLSHSDVVGVEPGWSVDPFGGVLSDSYVWGRGALDMKGMGIMQLWSLIILSRCGFQPKRDITLIVVPDEETGGALGAEWLTVNHPELCQGRYLLNEGSIGVKLKGGGENFFGCAIGDKGPIWVTLKAQGSSGHSALPNGENALEILTAGVSRVLTGCQAPCVPAEIKEFVDYFDLQSSDRGLASERMNVRAQLSNTISLTIMTGGIKHNTIPETAEAVLDCRLLPGQGIDNFLAWVRQRLSDERIRVCVHTIREASASPMDRAFWEIIEGSLERHYGEISLLTCYSPYFTDSLFFRKLGVVSYGLIPILAEEDDVSRIHGKDERISVENLLNGTKVITDVVRRVSQLD